MYTSSAAAATAQVFTVVLALIMIVVLFFVIRIAVTEGLKSYQKWREATGRDVPPADPGAPTAGR